MMDPETKKAAGLRLRRIAGQVHAIERMVDTDRHCVDLMHQLDAVQAAIGKVGEIVLQSHVQTWVIDAMRSGDQRECRRKVEELLAVFGRYGRIRERRGPGGCEPIAGPRI